MSDLVCVGFTTLDILARPVSALPENHRPLLVDKITLSAAGTAGGTAVVAAKLGLDVSLVSAIGDDINGEVCRNLMNQAGLDLAHVATLPETPTSTSILTIRPDGERPVFHMLGASMMTRFTPAALETARNARFMHFGGVGFPELSTLEAINAVRTIKEAGCFISCDLISPQPETVETLKNLLPFVDVFMPSLAEVEVLLGETNPEAAARAFVEWGAATCIIKRGRFGSLGIVNGTAIEVPARKITALDTTSCGDAFCAGFVSGVSHGMAQPMAMAYATATASLVAQELGTLGLLEGHDQVIATMDRNTKN